MNVSMKRFPFRSYLAVAVAVLLVSSCSKDEVTEFFVQTELQPYFDSFVEEALLRGKSLDMTRVNGVIEDIEGTQVLGRCEQASESGNFVTIDAAFWNKATYWEKEYVIFHELGHCVLDRRHLEDQNPDGTCVSMMQSGTSDCRMTYNAQTRSKYLDELFK